MTIHVFGAYFGLAASYFFQNKKALDETSGRQTFNYYSNVIAMVGTTFLFTLWPSFNAALGTTGSQQQRAIINTVLANTSSCITACLVSRYIKKHLDMIIVVNATLAGGIAIGAAADLINYPFAAMVIGMVAGGVSTLGFFYINPWVKRVLKLHDT